MEENWEVETTSRQEDNQPWESSDESSEYDSRADMPIQTQDIEVDIDEFPRGELTIVMDGLVKWPWTVYPNHLEKCLASAAKIIKAGLEETSSDRKRLQTLFRDAVPNVLEKCLDDKAIWKWSEDIQSYILESLLRLMDVIVLKAPQLLEEISDGEDVVTLLKALAMGFDKNCQYHIKHKEKTLIPSGLKFPNSFATPVAGSPVKVKTGEWYCVARKTQVRQVEGCDCPRCKTSDFYCWLSYCLNYFGQTPYGNGYLVLLDVLAKPEKLSPSTVEAVLHPVAKAAEFLTDNAAALFLEPCKALLQFLAHNLEKDVDNLSDKTKDGTFQALSLTLNHLQALIGRSVSAEEAESMVSAVQRRMVEKMLGFPSFNKQLSAVREINRLLENSRAVCSRDTGQSVQTTIEWLEANDILRHVLRSHLHHKQYVDQVEKIMKFLLQERRLSEEHLDVIWAATEKPDQFEAVKNNIFDLLADLAWSFSDEQLDCLFGRFERSQGRTPADTVKILQLVKKFARSDTKGVMATRLLELLWNMLHSGAATTEVLESAAFTEILGHYDSVDCASKEVYISRCLAMIGEGKSVIPSLQLLKEIVMLGQEESMFQNEIPRQTKLQQLNDGNDLVGLVVRSLDVYLDALNKSPPGVASPVGGVYTHEQHMRERLDFLLWVFQTGGIKLEWPLADQLWTRLVENPVSSADRERCFVWFCEALGNKWPSLTSEAQENLLSRKLCTMDPADLSVTAWRCFQKLFLWVNLDKKKLKQPRNDNSTVTVDLNLEGLQYTWKVALHSPVEEIVKECIYFLRDVHTCLSDNLETEVVQIRLQFVQECLRHLSVAVAASDFHVGGEAAEFSAIGSLGEGDRDDSTSVKDMEVVESEEELGKPQPKEREEVVEDEVIWEHKQGSGEIEAGRRVSPVLQTERCLRLLKVFITKCEGRTPRKVPAHGASFQGRPMTIEVNTVKKQSTCFKVILHANEYLASLRQKVAKGMESPVSRVRLVYQGKELLQDWQVVWQCGLQDGAAISATVNLIDCPSDPTDEQRLPGLLISRRKDVYDILFKLLDVDHVSVRDGAESLLMLLPTHPDILKTFLSVSDVVDQEKAVALLKSQFSARSRLFYALQVADGILMPINREPTWRPKKFRDYFLWSGGFKCLLSVFEPGALPEAVDNRMRRGCYTSALRLLKFLLAEESSGEPSEPNEGNNAAATCLIRADGSVVLDDNKDEDEEEDEVVSMSETDNGGIVVEQAPANKSRTDAGPIAPDASDLSQVLSVLTNLAWATAMNNIAAMGSPVPMGTPVKRMDELVEPNLLKSLSSASDDDEETGQDLDDAYVCHQAFSLMLWCLLKHKNLLESFFTSAIASQFIVDTVLHCRQKSLRYLAAEMFLKLSSEESGDGTTSAHTPITLALLAAKADSDRQPRQCNPYWELLCRLLQSCKDPEVLEIAKKQLVDEIKWLKNAPPARDEKDTRLEGHLLLAKTLVEVFNCQSIGSKSEGGLIQLLISQFLFPESVLLLKMEEKDSLDVENIDFPKLNFQFGILKGPNEEDAIVEAKCGTRTSRTYAFHLLSSLAKGNLDNFKEICFLLGSIHLREEWINDWEYLPSFGRKAMGGYVGLRNAGATCYMNSVFQQLYMQPQVRRSVLASEECSDIEKPDSVFTQLQAMFGALLGSNLDHYVPQGFWQAYRDYEGLPINLREHQDAFEFFNRLYDSIDETLKTARQQPTLTQIFGGCFVQQVISKGCSHRSEKEEPFAAISVDVKNKRDLTESLDAFVRGDLLEGDNAYQCEECQKKVDALKRVCVKTLPHTLIIHLKRFDFDYETMQRLKLKDRFEFPLSLDMKPYTVEGLALREKGSPSCLSQQQTQGQNHDNVGSQDNGATKWQGKGRLRSSLTSSDDVRMESPENTQDSRDDPSMDTCSKRQMLERSTDRKRLTLETAGSLESSLEGDSQEAGKESEKRVFSSGVVGDVNRQDEESSIVTTSSGLEIPVKSDMYYKYDLVGVVVHSGTAFAGHYYSYIKEREGDRMRTPGNETSGGRWMAFDDKRVEPYDVNNLEKDCFGGKYTVDVYDNFLKTTSPQEFDRPNSAYMLLYERCPQAADDVGSPVDSQSLTESSKDSMEGGNDVKISSLTGRDHPIALPGSIHRSVWEENLRFVHESHLLNKDYVHFLYSLIENNVEYLVGYYKQQALLDQRNRLDPRSDTSALSKMVDEVSRLTVDLATDFLCQVFLRTHSSLREDFMVPWRLALTRLLEMSPSACRTFQTKMVQQTQWLSQYILKSPAKDVRALFGALVLQSLQTLSRSLYLKPTFVNSGRNLDALGLDHLLSALIGLSGDAYTYFPQQYFTIFAEFAISGPTQRHALLIKRVVPLWVEFSCKLPPAVLHKFDLSALHTTVALLVRSCDVTKYYDMGNAVGDEGEEGDKKSPGIGPNQHYIDDPPLGPIPMEMYDWVTRRKYLNILVETASEQEHVVGLLQFLCWQNQRVSTDVLVDTMNMVRRSNGPDLKHILNLLLALLSVEDSLKGSRQKVVLLGSDIFRPSSGLLDMLVTKQLSCQKRYAYVKFVIRLARASPFAKQCMAMKRHDWKRIVEWLQEEVVATNSQGPLSPSATSNEDLGSPTNYLRRTTSLESSLNVARNILNNFPQ